MRVIHPDLDTVLTSLGATEEMKMMLVGFLQNQASSIAGQIAGLRANAVNIDSQADVMEAESQKLSDMVTMFTVEVEDEE